MTTLYVGNLTWDCTDDDLFTLFVESGLSPQTAVVVFGDEGRSRGYGLATFKDDAAGASQAIETWSSCMPDVGSESTEAGAARRLFSDAMAAAV